MVLAMPHSWCQLILCTIGEDTRYTTLLAKYRQHGHIMFNAVKWLLVGPPQVGKTTTKLRLLGDADAIRKKPLSTGLEKPVEMTYLDSKTAALIETADDKSLSTWTRLTIDDLALLFLHCIESQEGEIQDLSAVVPRCEPVTSEKRTFLSVLKKLIPKFKRRPTSRRTALEETSPPTDEFVTAKEEEVSLDETDAFLKQVYDKMSKHKEQVIQHLNESTTVYLIDTGGQPEFHDLLPLLLRGPAFYLMFFSLEESLDGRYTIKCTYNSPEAKEYVSGHSIKDVLYQMLNSFSYSNIEKEDKCCVQPQAFVIATHLDKVSPERVKAINEQLREALEFKDGLPLHHILVDATSQFGTLFIPVDNCNGGQEEVEAVRNFLTEAIKKCSKPVLIATSWLMFHMILRNNYEKEKVCTFEDSVQLAMRCGIHREDVKDVLTYIYRKLGTILYFEDVPSLSHLVICNPEIVYQAISNLIFSLYENLDTSRITGLISDRVFKAHMKDASKFLDTDYILEVLKHFRILASVGSGQYFMPCVLHTSTSEVATDTEPLIFCFPFRPNPDTSEELRVIPIGLATGLVVHLQSLPPTEFNGRTVEHPWEFLPIQHFKNQYQFQVYEYNTIRIVITGKHVELYLTVDTNKNKSVDVHLEVKKDVKEALAFLCKLHGYNKLVPHIRMYCQNKASSHGPHLAEYSEQTSQLKCTDVTCNVAVFYPGPSQREWFKVHKHTIMYIIIVVHIGTQW